MSITCSNLYRVNLCPGSAAMSLKAPPQPYSESASRGTILHAVYAGTDTVSELTTYERFCVDYCTRTTDELIEKIFPNRKPLISRELKLSRNGNYWGRCDFLAYDRGVALVIDVKFGTHLTEKAEENWQLRGYISGVKQDHLLKQAYGVIISPKLEDEERTQIVEYNIDAINEADSEIDKLLQKANDPKAPLNPSETACRYCPARSICPAAKGLVTSLVETHASEISDPNIMGDYLRKARIVKSVCESIEFHALQMAMKGTEIPGFTLKKGASRRIITDAMKAYEALNGTLTPEQFTRACNVQIGDLEEIYREVTGLKGKKAKEALETALTDFHAMDIKQGKQSLIESKEKQL